MDNTIGLFGTCGVSRWRDSFIAEYDKLGIPYFNPNVAFWKPELAIVEAEHLANDNIILFPITSEEYSLGSLSEVGFSVLNALKLDSQRDFIVLIDQHLDDSLVDAGKREMSINARALVLQHLLKQRLANVYIVDDLTTMLTVSLTLYKANLLRKEVRKYSTSYR